MAPETIIFIITKQCINSCSHCEILSSPTNKSSMSLTGIKRFLRQIKRVKSVKNIIFSGGEPFLKFPLLRNAIYDANSLGFYTSVWTNGYWISNLEDFLIAIKYLNEVGLNSLILSIDDFHANDYLATQVDKYKEICLEKDIEFVVSTLSHKELNAPPDFARGGDIILDGPIAYRGRAAESAPMNMAKWDYDDLDSCPHIDFENPRQLWLDPSGFIHICPGISLHNINHQPFRHFVKQYNPKHHKVVSELSTGGPLKLMDTIDIKPKTGYVDHCQFCFEIRKSAVQSHPELNLPYDYYFE